MLGQVPSGLMGCGHNLGVTLVGGHEPRSRVEMGPDSHFKKLLY